MGLTMTATKDMNTLSDTNKTDNTEIDEILEDLPNAWCEDCEHPRCVGKKKATKAALETIITQRCKEGKVEALQGVLDLMKGRTFSDSTDWGIELDRVLTIVEKRRADMESELKAALSKEGE